MVQEIHMRLESDEMKRRNDSDTKRFQIYTTAHLTNTKRYPNPPSITANKERFCTHTAVHLPKKLFTLERADPAPRHEEHAKS